MINIAIVYTSLHHKNTERLINGIKNRYDITLIDASANKKADLNNYDIIGFASGIEYGKFYNCVEKFLNNNLPENKKVFFIYTCAKDNPRFTDSIKNASSKKKATILGQFGCKGYNTYGPLKLIGGINRTHPDDTDVKQAITFITSVIEKYKTDLK